ncbi:MAG: hypothetical protein ACD_72C00023G0001 [uncultured bacterium]|nr:MAG: hypothetical protein ACD_72C00023G0001 [uncultured bacterium]
MADKTDTRPGFISDTLYNAEHFFTTSSDQKIETPAPQTMPDEEESVVDNVVSKPAMSKEPIMTPTVKVSGGDRVLREVNTGREIHDEPIMPKPVKSKFKPKYTEKHPNIKPPHPERQATPDIRIAKVDTHHAPLTINQKIDRQMKTILAVDDRVNKLQAQVEEDEKIPLLSDASTEELTKRSNVIKQLRLAKEQKRFLEKDLERLIDQKSKMNRVNIEKHKKGKDKGKIKTVTVEKRTAQGIGSLPTDPEYTLKKMQEQNKGRVFARETTLEARQANLDFERLLNGSEGVTNMLSAYVGAKGSESGKYFLDQAKELLAKAEKDMRGTNIHPDLVKQLRELQAIAVGYNNNPDANKPAAWLKDRPVVERQTPVVETLNDNKVDFTKILSANLQDEIDRINNRSQGGAYNVQNAAAALNRVIATKIDADRVDEFLNRAGKSAQEALVESGLTETDTENAQDVLKMVQRVRQELKSKETPKQDATVKPAELPDAPTDTVVDTRTVSAQQSLPPREFGGPKSRKALFEDDINTGPRTRRP